MLEKMTEVQKAKHAFSLHQDGLMWSRSQYLIAVQSAVLGGMYYLHNHGDCKAAAGLMILGIALTIFIFMIVQRDKFQRDDAFDRSGIPPVDPVYSWYAMVPGRTVIWLILADIILWVHLRGWGGFFTCYPRPPV